MNSPAVSWNRLSVLRGTSGLQTNDERATDDEQQDAETFAYAASGLGPPGEFGADTIPTGEGSSLTAETPSVRSAAVCNAVISFPRASFPRQRFTSLAKREGVVLDVGSDRFSARLTNLLEDSLQDDLGDLEAVFSFEEVSPSERSLITAGAIFYWNIGYYDDSTGQRHRESEIRFRRVPTWTVRDLQSAAREAHRIRSELGID